MTAVVLLLRLAEDVIVIAIVVMGDLMTSTVKTVKTVLQSTRLEY